MKTVADQFAETLAAAGVKRIYGIVGDSLNRLTDALRRQGKIGWVTLTKQSCGSGQRVPMGDTWHLRCGRGQCFYLNGNVYTARIEVAGRKYTWPLTVADREGAVASMAPVREAGARAREATIERRECELGTDESAAAAARVVTSCGLFATALHAVGAGRELVEKARLPPLEVGTTSLLPAAASRKTMKRADEKKCVDELVKIIVGFNFPPGLPLCADEVIE